MKFFPHNLGNTLVYQAVSASITDTAQYLNNRTGTLVGTASIALNITGSTGAPGTSYGPYTGDTGPRGATGATGAKGQGIYVLAHSRGTCSGGGAVCAAISSTYASNYLRYTSEITAPFCCDVTNTYQVYSTNDAGGAIVNGNTLYIGNGTCSTIANNSGNLTDGTTVFSTDSSGIITIQGTCSC